MKTLIMLFTGMLFIVGTATSDNQTDISTGDTKQWQKNRQS